MHAAHAVTGCRCHRVHRANETSQTWHECRATPRCTATATGHRLAPAPMHRRQQHRHHHHQRRQRTAAVAGRQAARATAAWPSVAAASLWARASGGSSKTTWASPPPLGWPAPRAHAAAGAVSPPLCSSRQTRPPLSTLDVTAARAPRVSAARVHAHEQADLVTAARQGASNTCHTHTSHCASAPQLQRPPPRCHAETRAPAPTCADASVSRPRDRPRLQGSSVARAHTRQQRRSEGTAMSHAPDGTTQRLGPDQRRQHHRSTRLRTMASGMRHVTAPRDRRQHPRPRRRGRSCCGRGAQHGPCPPHAGACPRSCSCWRQW